MSGMQDDVSRLVGSIAITWPDRESGEEREFILDNFGIDDKSVVQSILLREKRTRVLQAVQDIKGDIPFSDWNDLRREALDRVGNIGELSTSDAQELVASESGVALMLWAMFERKYPQSVTREDCKAMVESGTLTTAQGAAMMEQFQIAMGWMGNGTGRSGTDQGSTTSGKQTATSSGEPAGAHSQTLPVSA